MKKKTDGGGSNNKSNKKKTETESESEMNYNLSNVVRKLIKYRHKEVHCICGCVVYL